MTVEHVKDAEKNETWYRDDEHTLKKTKDNVGRVKEYFDDDQTKRYI